MNVNVYMRTVMYTIGPAFVEGDSPLINGPLCNMCKIFEEWFCSAEDLRESVSRNRPPFIYT
jgi:hypothetical protein